MTLIDARQHVTQPNGWTDCNPIGHAIHHTVSGGGFFFGGTNMTQQDEINHIKMIDQLHVSLDYGGFGYHTITFGSGRSYLTGNWRRARAHVKYRNHELVGSVAAGTFTNDLAPPAIIDGLGECVAEARRVFGRAMPVRGHGTWADPRAPSSCPGRLREQINSIVQTAETPVEEDDVTTQADWEQIAAADNSILSLVNQLTTDVVNVIGTLDARLKALEGSPGADDSAEIAAITERLDAIAKAASGDG